MSSIKMRVHNEMEARVLIKEINERHEAPDYDGTEWVTHEGKSICVTRLFQGHELIAWKYTAQGLERMS